MRFISLLINNCEVALMREQILNMLEKNSRIDLKDMAVMLGIRACDLRLQYYHKLG